MNFTSSIFLGILQGLTEFLPVSSSGHLVIAQKLLKNFQQPGVLFDVILHAGTVLSVIYYFRKKLVKLDTNYLKLFIVGTIPAVIFGFIFKDFFEGLFINVKLVGFALIVTGIMNFFTDSFKAENKNISVKNSLIIGLFQAMAMVPGISRSGSTIFSGTKRGISGKTVAEFSFLLSIPAVLGANLLEIISYRDNANINFVNYSAGIIFSFISGLLAINLVFKFLKRKKFRIFSYYALALGIFTLIFLN